MRAWNIQNHQSRAKSTQDIKPFQTTSAEKSVPERHLGFKSVNASSLPDPAIMEVTALHLWLEPTRSDVFRDKKTEFKRKKKT